MKKIILLFITIFSFFGFYSLSNADSLVSNSPEFVYLGNFKQNGLYNPGFYGVTPGMDVYSISSSGSSLITPYYSTGYTTFPFSSSIKSYSRFDSFDGSFNVYVYHGYNDSVYEVFNKMVYVDNINKRVVTYGWISSGYGTSKFYYQNGVIYVAGNNDSDYRFIYFTDNVLTVGIFSSSSISSPVNFNGQSFMLAPNNNVLTCSMNSNTYNVYSWDGYISNHGSVAIPPVYSTSFGTNCKITYDYINNVTGFSSLQSGIGYSQYYRPGSGFISPTVGKIFMNLYSSGGETYSRTLDIPSSDGVSFNYNGYIFISSYDFNNEVYSIYGKDGNYSNIYSNQIGNNLLNNIISSGTTITQVSNNPVVNNNTNNNYNNNYNSFSGSTNVTITGSTTNVNIPGTCSFGKKLNPVYYNLKWWCQVDDNTYVCPYGDKTPSLVYDEWFCEVQSPPNSGDNSSFWSGALSSTGDISSPGSDDIGDYNDNNYQNGTGDTSSILGDIFSDLSSNPINSLGEGISDNNFSYTLSGVSSSFWSGTYTFSSSGGYISNGTGGLKTGINCLLFDNSWNFLYKPSYSGFGLLSVNLTNHGNWLDYLYYIPQKMFDVAVGPYNTFILFMSFFQPLNDNVDVCYFGQVINIKYQRVFYGVGNGVSNISYLPDNAPVMGDKSILDYIAIFILFLLIFIMNIFFKNISKNISFFFNKFRINLKLKSSLKLKRIK